MQEAETLLEKWKHPDPYRPPTAPGGKSRDLPFAMREMLIVRTGSKYERNIPAPILDRMHSFFALHSPVINVF